MSDENLAKYLRLLEDDGEPQTVRRVHPHPSTPTNLIESLIQEKSKTNKNEIWALEMGPKNRAFTTVHDRDGGSRGRKNNGFLDSLGEPKVEVAEAAGVVLLTETFWLEASPHRHRREFQVTTARRIEEESVPVEVKGVVLESSGDLVVEVGESQTALAPMKALLDFGAPEEKFLVLRQRPPDKVLVTRGSPVTPEAFRKIERGIRNSVWCSMVDSSRSVLHVVEKFLQESQFPTKPSTVGAPFTPLGVSTEVEREEVCRLLKHDVKEAANCVLNLPLTRTIKALLKKFGKEQVEDAFSNVCVSNESSSSLKSETSRNQVPSQTDTFSQGSTVKSQSDFEFCFDPLNTPILGPSSKSNSQQRAQFNGLGSRNSTLSHSEVTSPPAPPKGPVKTPVNGTKVTQVPESSNRRTRSLDQSSTPTLLNENLQTMEEDPHSRSLDLIRKTMKCCVLSKTKLASCACREATGYGRKVAFIVSTDSLAISLAAELRLLNFKACVVKNALVRTSYYRERLKEFQAVILPLKDWKRLEESDKLVTAYVVLALDAQQHNEQRENLRTSMESKSFKDRKFEKVVTVQYVEK